MWFTFILLHLHIPSLGLPTSSTGSRIMLLFLYYPTPQRGCQSWVSGFVSQLVLECNFYWFYLIVLWILLSILYPRALNFAKALILPRIWNDLLAIKHPHIDTPSRRVPGTTTFRRRQDINLEHTDHKPLDWIDVQPQMTKPRSSSFYYS